MSIQWGLFVNLLEILLLIGVILNRKKLGKEIIFFIISLFFIVASELISSYIAMMLHKDNVMVFIVGIFLLAFFFLFYYYYQLFETPLAKKLQRIVLILFVLNYTLSIIFIPDFFKSFPNFTYFIECILLLVTFGIFLYETFQTEKILSITKYYPFWITVGIFVIYICLLPLLLISSVAQNAMSTAVFRGILLGINIIGYSTMIVGLFVTKKMDA